MKVIRQKLEQLFLTDNTLEATPLDSIFTISNLISTVLSSMIKLM